MDKATVGGLVMAFGLLALAVMLAPGGSFLAFWDAASAAVVIGGAVAATCIAFPFAALFLVPGVMKKVFNPKVSDLRPVIRQLVEFAEIARRDGILALESKTDEISDPFILLGIQMAVDGTDAELMEAVLRTEMEAVAMRHKTGKSLMETVGRYAPAFGMIGTLMGLIIMLGNMDDPAAIGPGMAVALITTLYGAMVSNMVFLPFADKLGFYSKRELEVREVIVRGILSIQDGDNPRVLEQKLNTFLPVSQRASEEKDAA
ncbi:MAG TPA: motility protein A [Planctomycetaceae bacterium]|uniref:motility protein A n=1 Tax=uncultured Rubinisphaera sp. TaxID=1678686 RepID=UPI000EE85490|nr:motility protein A [Planctomycetaceae bacterium]|tara:strand:- start:40 stop:819 length:780 start_codon:yes stop_codon:yes gene_type:complete